jgi:ribosome-binding factor A
VLPPLADDFGPEDGTDPKEFHAKPWDSAKAAGRKALQLCGQVKDALHAALGGCADDVLRGLDVVRVEPAPHSGRLKVVLAVADGGADPATAADHLQRAAGFLRGEVANAVHRRYAPELVWEVIG